MHSPPLSQPISPMLEEDLLYPWAPPRPIPLEKTQRRPLSTDFCGTERGNKGSLAEGVRSNSPRTVFERLTNDVYRRNEVRKKFREYKEKMEETMQDDTKPVSSSRTPSEVYTRLTQDAADRLSLTAKLQAHQHAQEAELPLPPRIPKSKEKELVTRLSADAKRRAAQQASQMREREESAVEAAVKLANSRHPPRPRDPKVQQRLQSPRNRSPPETERAPSKVFSVQQSMQSGERLMHAHSSKRTSPKEEERSRTDRISPRQVEELVGRLYSQRTRLGVSLSMSNSENQQNLLSVSSPRSSVKTLEEAMIEANRTSHSSLSKESTQVRAIEDIDDMLLRIKAKAVPRKVWEIGDAGVESDGENRCGGKDTPYRYEKCRKREYVSSPGSPERNPGRTGGNNVRKAPPATHPSSKQFSKPVPSQRARRGSEKQEASKTKPGDTAKRPRSAVSSLVPTPMQTYLFVTSFDEGR